jgi:hypothetical protein
MVSVLECFDGGLVFLKPDRLNMFFFTKNLLGGKTSEQTRRAGNDHVDQHEEDPQEFYEL